MTNRNNLTPPAPKAIPQKSLPRKLVKSISMEKKFAETKAVSSKIKGLKSFQSV